MSCRAVSILLSPGPGEGQDQSPRRSPFNKLCSVQTTNRSIEISFYQPRICHPKRSRWASPQSQTYTGIWEHSVEAPNLISCNWQVQRYPHRRPTLAETSREEQTISFLPAEQVRGDKQKHLTLYDHYKYLLGLNSSLSSSTSHLCLSRSEGHPQSHPYSNQGNTWSEAQAVSTSLSGAIEAHVNHIRTVPEGSVAINQHT
jgi:hypothetical protein